MSYNSLQRMCYSKQMIGNHLIQLRNKVTTKVLMKSNIDNHTSSSPKSVVLTILESLDSLLKMPGIASTDLILDDLKALNRLGKVVPLCYYMDTAQLLIHRNDFIRTELLIHICKENLTNKSFDNVLFEKSNQSRPINDPVNTLISYSISGLFRSGYIDEATKFWVRMTNIGYVTNRLDLEKMLDKLIGCNKSAPSLEIIDSIHKTMKAHLWHQNPLYYSRILKLYRYHILYGCNNTKDLDYALEKVETLWKEIRITLPNDIGSSVAIDLYALRLYCFSTAMFVNRIKCSSTFHSNSLYAEKGLAVLNEYLCAMRSSNIEQQQTKRISEVIVHDIKAEVNHILQNALSIISIDEEHKNAISTENLSRNVHFQVNSSLGSNRRAIASILLELARQGQSIEALSILKKFIETSSSNEKNSSTASYVSTVNEDRNRKAMLNDKNYLLEYLHKVKQKVVNTQSSMANDSFSTKLQIKVSDNMHSYETSSNRIIKSYAERNAALMYINEEKHWQSDLVCDILRSSNAIVSLSQSEANAEYKTDFDYELLRYITELKEIFEAFLIEHQLKPGSKFITAIVDAISYNAKCLDSSLLNISESYKLDWNNYFLIAQLVIDKVEDKLGRNSDVYHSLVKLLCTSNKDVDPNAVLKAVSVIERMKIEHCEVFPETLLLILDAATLSLDDANLYKVLSQLELIFHQFSIDLTLEQEILLLTSRIFAHSRLREGFKALQLLKKLRSIGGKADLRLYRWVINALHQSYPIAEGEWMVAKDPKTTIDYILREMIRDGQKIDADIISHLLRLFTKAIQISFSQGGYGNVIKEMENFIKQCSSSAYLNTFTIEINEAILKELIKAYCIVGMEEKAINTLRTAKEKFGINVTAASYEPIIFLYAGLKGLNNVGEDILTEMMNKRIPITDTIAATLVLGHIRNNDLSEALDCIQDLYNQHHVRPTINCWILLLDASLKIGDVSEAKRVVSLIKTLYTEQERNSLVGPTVPILSEKKKKVSSIASNTNKDSSINEELDINDEEHRRLAAMSLYWNRNPKGGDSQKNNSHYNNYSPEIKLLPDNAYLIKLGVPLGERQKGTLSDPILKDRFSFYGFKL